jgi:hypothetical protein
MTPGMIETYSVAADLELFFAKAPKEFPRGIFVLIPEWKERKFFDVYNSDEVGFVALH